MGRDKGKIAGKAETGEAASTEATNPTQCGLCRHEVVTGVEEHILGAPPAPSPPTRCRRRLPPPQPPPLPPPLCNGGSGWAAGAAGGQTRGGTGGSGSGKQQQW